MAEDITLKFVKSDYAPVLPVHDSFIMYYGHGKLGELGEDMRRAFYGHFKKDIKVKKR